MKPIPEVYPLLIAFLMSSVRRRISAFPGTKTSIGPTLDPDDPWYPSRYSWWILMTILKASSMLSRSLRSSGGRQCSAKGLVLSSMRKTPTSFLSTPQPVTRARKVSMCKVADISTNLKCGTWLILGKIRARISSTSVDPECTSSKNRTLLASWKNGVRILVFVM